MQFFQTPPPAYCNSPAYLLSDFFQRPRLLSPPSIPDWRVIGNKRSIIKRWWKSQLADGFQNQNNEEKIDHVSLYCK